MGVSALSLHRESTNSHDFPSTSVAQLVQHLPRTQKIAGSSPAGGSSSFSLEKKSCLRVLLLAFALSL